ncbi:MAG: CHAT domain-containing protein, partial [Candidatus Eisenbacteria bacterium]|nr:CHAT domain-containing protein [Candidatus Eisenbacteria bacterium]
LGLCQHRLGALAEAARACMELGMRDSALTLLDDAAAAWENNRSVPLDPEWRELRGSAGRQVYSALASLLLSDPECDPAQRLHRTYDRLQAFKARTLLERMLGPGDAAADLQNTEPVTLIELQEKILEDGELLLDGFLGPEGSLLFAITRRTARVVQLPEEKTLHRKLELFYSLLSDSSAKGLADVITPSRVAAALRRELLGEADDLITGCRRILFAPDGALNLLPLASLPDPQPGGDAAREIVASREIVTIPSATILALQRRAFSKAPLRTPLRILAVASSRTAEGELLRGAVAEVRELSRRYENVEAIVVPEDTCSMPIDGLLSRFDVLHFASHAEVDDQNPWRSTIILRPGKETANPRADRIARMRLPARLAVLSSCLSGAGRFLSGEGMQGLSTAFLSAGVPAVVATLWAVDDRASARLMEHFYRNLAGGKGAARSLQLAQSALRREFPHPYFWAGFVLVGDGDQHLVLKRRSDRSQTLAIGILSLGAIVVLGVIAVLAGAGRKWSARRRANAPRNL